MIIMGMRKSGLMRGKSSISRFSPSSKEMSAIAGRREEKWHCS